MGSAYSNYWYLLTFPASGCGATQVRNLGRQGGNISAGNAYDCESGSKGGVLEYRGGRFYAFFRYSSYWIRKQLPSGNRQNVQRVWGGSSDVCSLVIDAA